MKITIELPDTAKVVTYQVVYDDETDWQMMIKQYVIDTNALNQMREEAKDVQNA